MYIEQLTSMKKNSSKDKKYQGLSFEDEDNEDIERLLQDY